MKLEIHGLHIELPDDDRRVAIIQTLLFGGPLPSPLALPAAAPPPTVPLPEAMKEFWGALGRTERRELLLLAHEPQTAPELRQKLALSLRQLNGLHSTISRRAAKYQVPVRILATGRGPGHRRYLLKHDVAQMILALSLLPMI